MDSVTFQLFVIGVIPMFVSVILHFVLKKEKFQKMGYWKRQLLCGLIFGGLAICGTEFGVNIYGAIINARDAAVCCAALIFGGPAGIIAGLMGGIERWLCVYWGGAEFTRLGCTIATILCGFGGALVRKYLYDDEIPNFSQALMFGAIAEVTDMLLIFVTNISETRTAFYFVRQCAMPMITINALSVAVAVLLINSVEKEYDGSLPDLTPTINEQLQKGLIIVVLVGYIFTFIFNNQIQSELARSNTQIMLALNLDDAINEVFNEGARYMFQEMRILTNEVDDDITHEELVTLMNKHGLREINLIDNDGIIFQSTDIQYIGFDMHSTPETAEFLSNMKDYSRHVQTLRDDCSDDKACKFSAIKTDYGMMEIGVSLSQYHEILKDGMISVMNNFRIGESGAIIVIDEKGEMVKDQFYDVWLNEIAKNLNLNLEEQEVYKYTAFEEVGYYMYKETEGYKIVGVYPQEEADFSRNFSIYLSTFMETIVFGLLFMVIYGIMKNNVLNQIVDITDSLNQITEGNLNTVVDVKGNKEFISLSEDINQTVDTLKTLIAEANERIDSELKYAKEIQTSALPSVFPPYPERDEFDIYAIMKPAKEVGGDFYDLYLLDDDTLVFLVADVSGKGIPASLFMMRAKATLKSMAENGVSVDRIFTQANKYLSEGNDADMFVTAWMGMLDLKSGELKYANAGHNPPLIRHKDGSYEYIKSPPAFVLAGLGTVIYKELSIMIEPGDELFLYTDGVVEATSVDKELYGEDRLLNCLNNNLDKDAEAICETVLEDVEAFYKPAEQFDDITELSLRYLKRAKDHKE